MRVLVILLLLAVPAQAIEPSEYAARRERVAAAIGPDAMLIAMSPVPDRRNGDVSWPFRQDDNLLYLTGIDAANTSLILLPGETTFREVVFASERDPSREVWTGRIATFDEVKQKSGIRQIAPARQFRQFLSAALEGRPWGESTLYGYYRSPGMPRFLEAVRAGRAEVWLLLGRRPEAEEDANAELRLANELRRRYPEVRIRNATPIVEAIREVKSPAELQIIQRAIDITAEAHKAAMRRVLTATHEYQVQATIEHTFRDRGACCWGFPSIVASGRNATTLHYETNNDPIPRDALIVADIGAEVEGYTADVTRTFPADGTFSPEQRAIYEAVLTAQNETIPLIRAGTFLTDVHLKAEEVLGRELLRLELVTRSEPEQTKMYFVHGVGHPLGLQVHDVYDRTRKLEAGMVVTNEPGIYVREDDVRASPVFKKLSPEDQQKIEVALKRYGGIGVRIEDDVLVTNGAPRILSLGAPRTVTEIEEWMR